MRHILESWVKVILATCAIIITALLVWSPVTTPVLAASPIFVRADGSDAACNGEVNVAFSVAVQPNCAVKTIQQGITLVDPGGTVNVAGGTYTEQVTISKSLTLRGDPGDPLVAGPGTSPPVLDGGGAIGDGFSIAPDVDNVTIEGFIIRDFNSSGPGIGVCVKGFNTGVSPSENVVISNNQFDECVWAGVMVFNDGQNRNNNWTVSYNVVNMGPWSPNTNVYGIELTNARNSTIAHNVVSGGYAGVFLSGRGPDGSSFSLDNNVIQSNTISDSARFNIQFVSYTDNSITALAAADGEGQMSSMAAYEFGGLLQNIDPIRGSQLDTGPELEPLSTGPILQNVEVISNSLTNNVSSDNNLNSGRIIFAYISAGVVGNLDILSNSITIVLTDSTVVAGSSVRMLDVAGNSNFTANTYRATGAMAGGSSFYHALDIDGAQTGNWMIRHNDMDGKLLGAFSAAIRLRNNIPGAANIDMISNNITGFYDAIRSSLDDGLINVAAAFNRLVGNSGSGARNDAAVSPTLQAVNNWWGCNSGPNNSPACDAFAGSGVVQTDPWLTLRLSASPTTINLGQSAILTGSLTINANDQDTAATGLVPDGIPLVFTGTLGTIQPTDTTLQDGLAPASFTGTTIGTAVISATVDNQVVTTTIEIKSQLYYLPIIFKNASLP